MSQDSPEDLATKEIWRPFIYNTTLVVVLFIIGIFVGLIFRNNKLIEEGIESMARAHFQSIVLTRRWNARYGGVYVEKKPGIESNPYLENPDITAIDGKVYTKKNPALMTREISEYAQKEGHFLFHITSLNPLNPNNQPDKFEREALLAFEQGKKEIFGRVNMNGKMYLRYMAPLYTEQACLGCHAKQGYQVGQVRGGISVSFDISKTEQNLKMNTYVIVLLATITILLILGIIYFFVLGLIRKLTEARTQLKKSQIQLIQSEKMAGLGTLVAGVAHEINNPVNFVHLSAQSLETELRSFKQFILDLAGEDADEEVTTTFNERFDKFTNCLTDIHEGSQRIRTIVSDLRTFSRLDEAEKKTVNIVDGLKSTLRLVEAQYRDTVQFICDFQIELELECWAAQLNQVFMNIMTNGCQAINAKQIQEDDRIMGTLMIRTLIQNQFLVIAFQDNGCGMTPEVQQKIFEPFFTTKPVGDGVGMGMSIVFGIVKKHGGRIEVNSVVNKGTTISIFLPLSLSNSKF